MSKNAKVHEDDKREYLELKAAWYDLHRVKLTTATIFRAGLDLYKDMLRDGVIPGRMGPRGGKG